MFSPETGYADLAAAGQALSPLDGRYRLHTQELTQYLSEAALNRTRIYVEIEWMIELLRRGVIAHAPLLSDAEVDYLRALPREFNADSIAELAQIEAATMSRQLSTTSTIDLRRPAPSLVPIRSFPSSVLWFTSSQPPKTSITLHTR